MNFPTTLFSFKVVEYKSLVLLFFLFFFLSTHAQQDTIHYSVEASGLVSSGEHSPFWLQNRQYGITSPSPTSTTFQLGIHKPLIHTNALIDYGFKANALVQNDPSRTSIFFHELYLQARLSVFDITIGSRKEHLGNQDSTLSGGGILFSHNARPMPKISAGIEQFTTVPFTGNFLEVKGALVHGWFTDNTYFHNILLHHKYAYARLGGSWPVHIQYGLDHVAQWGGKSQLPSIGQQPVSLSAYKAVFLGGKGGSEANISDQINALGNHIISQSTRMDIEVANFNIVAYWQNISEDGPIRFITKTMNLPDGLWGISIKNKIFPFVKGILYEYLNTTDQSGPYHDKDGIVYGGNDSYYNNSIYSSGWSYFSRTLGSPFLTSSIYNKNAEIRLTNTRVQVHHFGLEGNIQGFDYTLLTSFSKNYGNYYPAFPAMKRSTSLLFQINKSLRSFHQIEIGGSIGMDRGTMYGNNLGGMLSIRKTGNLFHY